MSTLTILPWVFLTFLTASWQHSQSHGFLGKNHSEMKWNVILLNKRENSMGFKPCWDLSINGLAMTSWLYFRKKQHTSSYSCKVPLFLKDDHLNLEPLKKAGSCYNRNQHKNQMCLKAITMPPPPPDWAFAIFFFLGGLFPTPGYTGRDNSPPPSSWLTWYTIFSTSLYKSKTTHFHNFYEHFPEFIESRRIMDVIMHLKHEQ